MTELERAGRARLADELDDLRCAIAAADYGEPPFPTPSSNARTHARIAELEPLVDAELDRPLAADD